MTNPDVIKKYIEGDLWTWLKEVSVAFTKLTFKDNFQSFTAENVSIPAGEEVAIPNQFRGRFAGAVPQGRIIVRQKGDATIVDGDSVWTADLVYLKNPSQNDAVVSVLFFK